MKVCRLAGARRRASSLTPPWGASSSRSRVSVQARNPFGERFLKLARTVVVEHFPAAVRVLYDPADGFGHMEYNIYMQNVTSAQRRTLYGRRNTTCTNFLTTMNPAPSPSSTLSGPTAYADVRLRKRLRNRKRKRRKTRMKPRRTGMPGEIAVEAGAAALVQDPRDVARIEPVFGQPSAQIEGPGDVSRGPDRLEPASEGRDRTDFECRAVVGRPGT
jgi:hypothetical protein